MEFFVTEERKKGRNERKIEGRIKGKEHIEEKVKRGAKT
jgi:hypothetical protein